MNFIENRKPQTKSLLHKGLRRAFGLHLSLDGYG